MHHDNINRLREHLQENTDDGAADSLETIMLYSVERSLWNPTMVKIIASLTSRR
jgi:hypothetical protein